MGGDARIGRHRYIKEKAHAAPLHVGELREKKQTAREIKDDFQVSWFRQLDGGSSN